MPLWVKIYVTVYLLFVVSNLGYLLYVRSKLWIILYDFFSGLYIVFLMTAYWNPKLGPAIGLIHIPLYVTLIATEFYMTIWGNFDEMGVKIPKLNDDDVEIAKTVSILFSAPAYICGGLLCFDIVMKSMN
jgi:hypothetical protein